MLDLVQFVFAAGIHVVNSCETAKQCEVEVVRIAIRTQNVLGTLKSASDHFENNVELRASLLELKDVFETINSLVGRCGMPVSIKKRASLIWARSNPNQVALLQAERRLEQVTNDLGLPLLSDIKQQLNRMDQNAQRAASAAADLAKVDAEAIADLIRTEIRRAMKVPGAGSGGASIQDMISAEITHLQGDDDISDENAKTRGTLYAAADGSGDSAATKHQKDHAGTEINNSEMAGKGGRTGGPSDSSISLKGVAGGLVVRLGRVRFEDLEEGEILGEGTFGTVLAGTYRGRDVAVKKARGALGSSSIMDAFRQEAEIHYSMRHPNIVEVIAFGLGDKGRPPCMVMERMHETLYDLLGVEGIGLPMLAGVSIIRDICEGLKFLHLHRIVHRDLKSLNVLLDESWVAKICDFGLAKVNSTVAASTGGNSHHSKVGSDFWMAPEVHAHHKATRASDVFSLHVVIWEVLTQQRAGVGMPIGERLLRNPDAHLPVGDLDCPDLVASHMRSIFEECGAVEPSLRPAMQEVYTKVEKVLKALQDPEANPLPPASLKTSPSAASPPSYDDFLRGKGTTTAATRHMSSGASGASGGSVGAAPPVPRREAVMSEGVPRRPLPPLPPRSGTASAKENLRFNGAFGVSQQGGRRSLVLSHPHSLAEPTPGSHGRGPAPPPNPRPGARPSITKPRLKKDDRGVMQVLLQNCSPGPVGSTTAWKISDGWGMPVDLSRWYGVRACFEDVEGGRERVTQIHMPGNNVHGPLPEELSELDCLTTLHLPDNQLTGVVPSSFGYMNTLESLNISKNKLTGGIPPELGSIYSLENLELHHTGLYGDIPDSLGNLQVLERLDLSDCDLWGPIPKSLGRLRALRVLRLGSNRLSGGIPDELAGLELLEELDLAANKLTGNILAKPGMFAWLKILNLSDNLLEGGIPPEICQLENLKELRLYRNFGLSSGIPAALGNLPALEEIDLSATQLGGEIPVQLGQLAMLTKLALGSCRLTGTIPPELGQLRNLKHLGLFDNGLTGLIPYELLQLPHIRMLNLERNGLRVSRARIGGTKNEIKKILPKGCTVRL